MINQGQQGRLWLGLFFGALGGVAGPLLAQPDPSPIVFGKNELGFDIARVPVSHALYQTLAFSPQIALQQQEVEQKIGGVTVTAAPFDTRVVGTSTLRGIREDRTTTPRVYPTPTPAPGQAAQPGPTPLPNPFVRRDSLYEWELGIVKKFRNGITIEPTTRYRFAGTDNAAGFNNRSEFGFNFGLTIPLARGLGVTVNEAPEIAARFDWKASWFSLRNVTSQAILTTLTAYWRCCAAEQRYRYLVENESISARLVGNADSMVKAQELATSQLAQVRADLESTTAQRIQGEQGLIQARQQLALAMGSGPDVLPIAPLPQAALPEPPARPAYPDLRDLTTAALALRDDLRAAQLLEKSRKTLVTASYLNLRPIVNLRLDMGYVPFDVRSQSTTDEGGEFTGSAALNLDWPLQNSLQRGTLIQDIAVYAQSRIRAQDLARNIVSSIISDFAELRSAAAQLWRLREASKFNRQALAAQEELFSLGQSALTDLITARQRLLTSELDQIGVHERYAIAIAQLRYDTGTLLPWDEQGSWITPQLWTTVPFTSP